MLKAPNFWLRAFSLVVRYVLADESR
jgi:hypothetical protein